MNKLTQAAKDLIAELGEKMPRDPQGRAFIPFDSMVLQKDERGYHFVFSLKDVPMVVIGTTSELAAGENIALGGVEGRIPVKVE